jgi:tape measure domain-containing protein
MALNLDAVLRVVAQVDGSTALQKLGADLAGISQKAGATISPFGRMQGAMRAVADVGAAIGLAAVGRDLMDAGVAAQASKTRISALAGGFGEVGALTDIATKAATQFALGNVDAQNAVTDLYGRLRPMGVGLKDIETVFFGVNKAARVVGLSSYDTSEVLLQLSQALGSGALQGDELRSIMERMPAIGQAVAKVMGVNASEIKKLGSEGKITTAVIIEAAKELLKLDVPPPVAVQLFQKALADLRTTLGERLLPLLTPFVQGLTGLLVAFTNLPGPIQTTIVALGALAIAAGPVASVITGLGNALMLIGSLQIGATIAGWAAVLLPVKAAFVGFLGWIGATLIPGLLAFFSGPIGWTVLAVAAVVAMAIAFREPLMNFISWLWNWGEPVRQFWRGLWNGLVEVVGFSMRTVGTVITTAAKLWWSGIQTVWGAIGAGFDALVVQPISNAWTAVMDMLPSVMQSVADTVQRMWTGLVEGVKSIVRGMLQYIANQINTVAGLINRLIAGYNALPNFGDIPLVPTISVPAFAAGGTVNRPTLAMVGEGGEREYIVPESKMATASARYLSGARGSAVIPAGGGGVSSGQAPIINITTGPLMEMNGQRYVTIDEYQAGIRQTAAQIVSQLRTPAGKRALGVA